MEWEIRIGDKVVEVEGQPRLVLKLNAPSTVSFMAADVFGLYNNMDRVVVEADGRKVFYGWIRKATPSEVSKSYFCTDFLGLCKLDHMEDKYVGPPGAVIDTLMNLVKDNSTYNELPTIAIAGIETIDSIVPRTLNRSDNCLTIANNIRQDYLYEIDGDKIFYYDLIQVKDVVMLKKEEDIDTFEPHIVLDSIDDYVVNTGTEEDWDRICNKAIVEDSNDEDVYYIQEDTASQEAFGVRCKYFSGEYVTPIGCKNKGIQEVLTNKDLYRYPQIEVQEHYGLSPGDYIRVVNGEYRGVWKVTQVDIHGDMVTLTLNGIKDTLFRWIKKADAD